MIDKRTGRVLVAPGGPVLFPLMTAREFSRLRITRDMYGTRNYRNYRFEASDSRGRSFDGLACFERSADGNQRILRIHLTYAGIPVTGVDESLHRLHRWHTRWLRKLLGVARERRYSWGCVLADWEIHTPNATVCIDYRRDG